MNSRMTEADNRGARQFLRRLRDLMARDLPESGKLARIVSLISGHMVSEVCSIYLRRSSGEMELYATEGLNPQAIRRTILAPGEGLIGEIARHARPLVLRDAESHPAFSYHPETGEEIYKSFMGVPVIRMGHVVGVLSVQNRRERAYIQDETELLETVAMLLAEMLAGGGEALARGETAPKPLILKGVAWAEGIGMGQVVLHEPRIQVMSFIAESAEREHVRLDDAIYVLRATLDRMRDAPHMSDGGAHKQILDAYRMYADDQSWVDSLHEAIDTGLTAEAAVERVRENTRARFFHQSNPYLRERLHDLDDLANRLLRHLTGTPASRSALEGDSVLLARNMGPADLLDYDQKLLRGVVLEEGSAHAHVTIVARALDLPLLGHMPNLLSLARAGTPVIVDGMTGEFHLNPEESLREAYREKIRFRAKRLDHYRARAHEPARTKDGADINLLMHAGLLIDLNHLDETGASGIGLFRTELQFMIGATMPRLEEQVALYGKALEAAGERPVVFRTLDIGGDKILPYMSNLGINHRMGDNPALGWRAIRIALDKPVLLRYQIRALLTAAADREFRILFPMIATCDEYERARALLQKEQDYAQRHNRPRPSSVLVGAMLEVPSLLFHLDALLPRLDFLSVGTNDLMQFFFASDRSDPHMGERYDPLDVSFLRALRAIAEKAARAGVPVTICGEMASAPLQALALMGLGFRNLTLPPTAIGLVKDAVRAAHLPSLEAVVGEICENGDPNPRETLEKFAHKHKIPITP